MEMKNIYSGRLRGGGEDTWRRYNGSVAARWAEVPWPFTFPALVM